MRQKTVRKRDRKRRRKTSAGKKAVIFLSLLAAVLLSVMIVAACFYLILQSAGRIRLQGKQGALPKRMQEAADEQQSGEAVFGGSIRYQGKAYAYKENILTFLCMGIDKSGEVEASGDLYRGGQADALFLVAMDPDEKQISVIGINRDTMTELSVFDRNGLYVGEEVAQIALAHAYGEGLEESCENTVKAVSNLFYGLPIHGYFALNMEVINILNDAVGGVDVIIPESAEQADMGIGDQRHRTGWKTGDRVRLIGNDAFTFLRYRDTEKAGSAEARLERQKQYLQSFLAQAKEAVKQDITLPVKLYTKTAPYMVTDISAGEAVYLAGEAITYGFQQEDIHTMRGTVKMGEIFEEFYQDDEALYELILQVFYKELP